MQSHQLLCYCLPVLSAACVHAPQRKLSAVALHAVPLLRRSSSSSSSSSSMLLLGAEMHSPCLQSTSRTVTLKAEMAALGLDHSELFWERSTDTCVHLSRDCAWPCEPAWR